MRERSEFKIKPFLRHGALMHICPLSGGIFINYESYQAPGAMLTKEQIEQIMAEAQKIVDVCKVALTPPQEIVTDNQVAKVAAARRFLELYKKRT